MRLLVIAAVVTIAYVRWHHPAPDRRANETQLFSELAIVLAEDYPAHDGCDLGTTNPDCRYAWQAGVARTRIFEKGTASALRQTLSAVRNNCVTSLWVLEKGRVSEPESACRGAAVAISFLTDADSDEQIRRMFSGNCQAYRAITLTASVELMGKRPDPAAWLALARTCATGS